MGQRLATPVILVLATWLVGCRAEVAMSTPPAPTETATSAPTVTATPAPTATATAIPTADALSDKEIATLNSLEQVDDYPLYTMRYYGAYADPDDFGEVASAGTWACSLFAALGDEAHMLYGRNFDWQFSPAVLLFTAPPDGYASVSMVDIAYFFEEDVAKSLTEQSLETRQILLLAPYMPFDGMNEHGLAVGMAAVQGSRMPLDPDKPEIDSLDVIRKMLDHARDVDEALAVLQSYNVSMVGGPPLHYLIADATGRAVLVEFYEGEVILLPNETPWHLATNHLRVVAEEIGGWGCWRYKEIDERLVERQGRLSAQEALDLLEQISQPSTQWSVVYEMSQGQVHVSMGRAYDAVHIFELAHGNE